MDTSRFTGLYDITDMLFERNKLKYFIKKATQKPSPQRLAAAKRTLKKQQDKYPLFADEIAANQPTPEERIKYYNECTIKRIKSMRRFEAQMWLKARAMLKNFTTDSRERFINYWNTQWSGPRTGTYLCELIRHWDGLKMVWLKKEK